MGSLYYSCSGEVEYWSLAPWCHSGRGAEGVLLPSFRIMAEWEFVCERSLFLDDRGRLILTWGYVTYQMIPIQHQIVYKKKHWHTHIYTHTHIHREDGWKVLYAHFEWKIRTENAKKHISMSTIRKKEAHTGWKCIKSTGSSPHTHTHTHWYYFTLLVHEWASWLAERSSECITNH